MEMPIWAPTSSIKSFDFFNLQVQTLILPMNILVNPYVSILFFILFLIQFFDYLNFGLLQSYQDQGEKVEFSGPLLSQSHRVDELLERHERHIRQAVRRSWFQRGTGLFLEVQFQLRLL